MPDLTVNEISREELRSLLPHPKSDANKYTRGKLFLLAGSAEYPGAACLAAFAAQRAGSGYVEVCCAEESLLVVRAYRPSLVARSWEGIRVTDWPMSVPEKPCACVVGPGLSPHNTQQANLTVRALRADQMPMLVDGGAIVALASGEGRAAANARTFPLVVTPHGGEAARLAKAVRLDATAREESWPPERMALELARAYSCVMVLKGPDTFVSDGNRTVAVRQGTAALAKAGTGDVLAGVIGALLAQGINTFEAAVLGASLHADAGCLAEDALTDVSVVPEDLIDYLPTAIRELSVC